jgi:hypothetical protein
MMNNKKISREIPLNSIHIKDEFWTREMELVRKEVIPYQWNALNDNVEGAAPSYCMHNFRAASKMAAQKKKRDGNFVEPKYTFRGFETLPEDPDNPEEDKFYGLVFQDTDFSKWIEAVAYSLIDHPDKNLEELADNAIDLVCSAQLENGYLDTYYILNGMDAAFTNLRDHHELYCFGHLTEGAVAYYQATGKDKLLKAACRFADYIDSYFGTEEGKCHGYPGHEIAEMALVRLYEVTGEERYKALSRYFIEQRGTEPNYFDTCEKHPEPANREYYQVHLPVREQKRATGHAVRAVYLYSGMADIARLYQDESLYEACDRLWDNITRRQMYITGGIGSTHLGEAFSFDYDLPNDTVYAETCASIGMVFFAWRMLKLNPNSKYSDVMELELYNGVLSGIALDGKSFFYVNPLEVNPEACRRDERKHHVKSVRQKWFGCACCPPNIARLLSSVGKYAVTENEDTLFVHLYIGSTLEKTFSDGKIQIQMDSEMPWEGKAVLHVTGEKPVKGTIALRIPGWTDISKARVLINETEIVLSEGKNDNVYEWKDGYLYIEKEWKDDVITLDVPMDVHLISANTNVREDIGRLAVKRGPVVYCLEEADNGKNLHLLQVNPDAEPVVTEEDSLGHRTRNIKIAGRRKRADDDGAPLYQCVTAGVYTDVTLTFVPYYTWNNRGEGEMSVWVR